MPKRTHCKRNHLRTPENLFKNGTCKPCKKIRDAFPENREKQRAYDKKRCATPEHKAKKALYNKEYHFANRDEHNALKREYSAKPEVKEARHSRDRSSEGKAKKAVYAKNYSSKPEAKLVRNTYQNYRYSTDLNFKIGTRLRVRMGDAIKNGVKVGSAVRDLGCTIEEFKLWIYSQFEAGMGWDNHGEWHLDHVKPLASFDLTDREEFLEAANWLNYQPLWAKDNLTKGAS